MDEGLCNEVEQFASELDNSTIEQSNKEKSLDEEDLSAVEEEEEDDTNSK
jgi:hypothetical protein